MKIGIEALKTVKEVFPEITVRSFEERFGGMTEDEVLYHTAQQRRLLNEVKEGTSANTGGLSNTELKAVLRTILRRQSINSADPLKGCQSGACPYHTWKQDEVTGEWFSFCHLFGTWSRYDWGVVFELLEERRRFSNLPTELPSGRAYRECPWNVAGKTAERALDEKAVNWRLFVAEWERRKNQTN